MGNPLTVIVSNKPSLIIYYLLLHIKYQMINHSINHSIITSTIININIISSWTRSVQMPVRV